jgi:hypothetical protein
MPARGVGMNLDKLQVNATIRSGWQALDLGFLMARAWWKPLTAAGLISVLPLFIVLLILFPQDPFWAAIVVWWLKPFWERLPLFVASRLLFQESSGTISSLKSLALKDSLPWLLWRRFSVQRAFDAPVTVLEGLKGAQRRDRMRVLHGKYSDVAFGNQFVCFCFELLLGFGIVMLIDFFTPEKVGLELYNSFDDLSLAGEWVYTLAAFGAMILVIPFHAMAGFALYLNRRIELEAWDIEISFRNLANRKQSSIQRAAGLVPVLLLLGLIGMVHPDPASAATQHDRGTATELIQEVMAGADFGEEKMVRKWRFKDWNQEEDDDEESIFPEWMIEVFEWWEENVDWGDGLGSAADWLKIILIVVFAGLLLYLLRRYRGPLGNLIGRKTIEAPPQVLFGLDVTPESLPADVPALVMELWNQGNVREALGLLYRASLSRLIDKHELAFRSSHTESECAQLVREQGIVSLSEYFTQLTEVWRRLAYGHQQPQSEIVDLLCKTWRQELADEPV